ncbi:MAG: transposase [Fibrobacteres bacterium]|nr:transposase [Fibrobacterota bacterium]
MKSTRSNAISVPESDLDSGLSNEALQAQVKQLTDDNRYLREQLELLKRHIFGHKSEKIPAALLGAESDLFGVPDRILLWARPSRSLRTSAPSSSAGHGRVALPDDLPARPRCSTFPRRRRPVRAAASNAFISEMMSASSWTSCRRGLPVFASCAPRWPAGNAPNAVWHRPNRR